MPDSPRVQALLALCESLENRFDQFEEVAKERIKRLEIATERIEKDVTRLKDAAEVWRVLRTGAIRVTIGIAALAGMISAILQIIHASGGK